MVWVPHAGVCCTPTSTGAAVSLVLHYGRRLVPERPETRTYFAALADAVRG